jgi:Uma2 family endonuclease
MRVSVGPAETKPFVLHFGPLLKKLSDDDFFEFCQANRDLRIERTSDGDIIIMSPTGSETGGRNFNLAGMFHAWVRTDGTGKGFDSSTGFILPNGAERSPDLSWIRLSRWNALTHIERQEFAPLCPDFVVELTSPSDALSALQAKMEEYIQNGAELGWLIDPMNKRVYIYRPHAQVECLDDPDTVSGEPLLKGFVLDVRELW